MHKLKRNEFLERYQQENLKEMLGFILRKMNLHLVQFESEIIKQYLIFVVMMVH